MRTPPGRRSPTARSATGRAGRGRHPGQAGGEHDVSAHEGDPGRVRIAADDRRLFRLAGSVALHDLPDEPLGQKLPEGDEQRRDREPRATGDESDRRDEGPIASTPRNWAASITGSSASGSPLIASKTARSGPSTRPLEWNRTEREHREAPRQGGGVDAPAGHHRHETHRHVAGDQHQDRSDTHESPVVAATASAAAAITTARIFTPVLDPPAARSVHPTSPFARWRKGMQPGEPDANPTFSVDLSVTPRCIEVFANSRGQRSDDRRARRPATDGRHAGRTPQGARQGLPVRLEGPFAYRLRAEAGLERTRGRRDLRAQGRARGCGSTA